MLLQNFLEDSARRTPHKVALIHRGEHLTYDEIDRKANQVAALLRSQGVRRGDRVAIFLDNSVESVVSLFGILKADAVFLMLSPQLKAAEAGIHPEQLRGEGAHLRCRQAEELLRLFFLPPRVLNRSFSSGITRRSNPACIGI